MANAATPTGRGWYPDPFSKGELLRKFDGARWTDQTRPIPADYDATRAGDSPAPAKKTESQRADEAAPRANPTESPALGKSKQKDENSKSSNRPTGEPAKNGTVPMFSTPTEKAATGPSSKPGPDNASAPKQEESEAAKTDESVGGPAFARPTVKAERPAGGGEKSSAPVAATDVPTEKAPAEPPPLEPELAFTFAKPANGGGGEAVEQSTAPPAASATAPAEEPLPSQATPEPTSAEDGPEEDSETVNNAFANSPQVVEHDSTPVADDHAGPVTSSKGNRSRQALRSVVRNRTAVTWAAAALLAVSAIVVPLLVPSPVRGVAAECRPISEVVVAYDDATDFSVDSDSQAQIAAAVSTGDLNEDLADLVTTAVEENNLQPVVDRCLPQDSES